MAELRAAHQLKVEGVIDTPAKAALVTGITLKYYGPSAAVGAKNRVCNGHLPPMAAMTKFNLLYAG